MDIYTLIRVDHEKAKAVIRQIQALPDERHAERLVLFYPLMEDLIVHNDAEEQTFYVALEEHDETESEARHSAKEHHEAADMLEKLDDEEMKAATWREKFGELCKDLMHHIDKEEYEVFSKARLVLTDETAMRLADEMTRLKKQKQPIVKKQHAEHYAAQRH